MSTTELHHGDCLEVLASMPSDSVAAIVTDPPYGIAFMQSKWDYDVPSKEIWVECLRVLKPGGHLLAFAGTRTQHRMAVNIEDAGFEIRDMIMWCYGSGFPKSQNVGKAIDKRGGNNVSWFGPWLKQWRTEKGITQKEISALFPSKSGQLTGCVANWELGFNLPTPEQFNLIRDTFGLPFESINAAEREVVGKSAHKSGIANGTKGHHTVGGTIAQHVDIPAPATPEAQQWDGWGTALKPALEPITVARKPFKGTVANNVLTHGTGAINIDGCRVGTEERFNLAAGNKAGGNSLNMSAVGMPDADGKACVGRWPANLIHDGSDEVTELFGDAQRFFYVPKCNKKDRDGSTHPTMKPTDLMAYLCRLVTPPDGIILDPFMGSGSTGKAAVREGFSFIGIERDEKYFEIASSRVATPKQAQLALIA